MRGGALSELDAGGGGRAGGRAGTGLSLTIQRGVRERRNLSLPKSPFSLTALAVD